LFFVLFFTTDMNYLAVCVIKFNNHGLRSKKLGIIYLRIIFTAERNHGGWHSIYGTIYYRNEFVCSFNHLRHAKHFLK
jgi:hypothetical protein